MVLRTEYVMTIALSVGIVSLLSGCQFSGYGQPPPPVVTHIVLTPTSSPQNPIDLTLSNPTTTLTASESGYSRGFSATVDQGAQCISVSRAQSSTNQFTVTRVTGPCAGAVVSVVDSNGITSFAYFATQ